MNPEHSGAHPISIETVPAEIVAALARFDTPTISNAIETFDVRNRDEGFADSSVSSLRMKMPPICGYAATARVRTSNPPMLGAMFPDRTDWWNHILKIPAPRIVVIQDVDSECIGFGTILGEVHANVLVALGCIGAVTNGAVRDVPALEAMNFPVLAGNITMSHAYAHIVDFGHPVEIGGLAIAPGDLLHADCHGLLSVPKKIAAQIPAVAEKALAQEREIIAFCRSKNFSVEKLREIVKGTCDHER